MPITTVPYTQVYGPLSLPGVTCQLWLDGADPEGNGAIPTNGITLSRWVDKSGIGNTATAYTTGATYSTTDKSLLFNGTTDYYATNYTSVPTNESFFAVFSTDGSKNTTWNDIIGTTAFYGRNFNIVFTNGIGWRATYDTWGTGNNSFSGTFSINTVTLAEGILSNGYGSATLNGGTFSTPVNQGLSGISNTNIGAGIGADFFKGKIFEIVIYNSVLGTSQRQAIEGYLAQKWGLTSSLPGGHPGYSQTLYATGAYQPVIPFTLTPNQTQIPNFTKTPFNTIINRNLGGVSYYNLGQSYWNSFYQPYLETLVLANSAATHSTVTTITPSSPTGFTATLAPNGNLYIYPWNVTAQITVLTISTGALNYMTGTGITNTATYYNSCLGPDGNIYYAPYNTASVGVLYPSPTGGTFSISAITGTNSQTNGAYCGIVLAPNGKMYCVPRSYGGATSVGIIDPIAKTFTTMPNSSVATGNGYIGGVLAPNGKIYCIPFADSVATSVGIIDPVANTFTLMPNSSVTTFGANTGGVLAPNGKIYCCAMDATYIGIIDPVLNTFNSTSITGAPGSTSYGDGCLGPNGKIYLPPRNGASFGVIDPVAGTLTTGVLSGSEFGVSILGSDGKIYLPSATSSKIGVLSFSGVTQLPDLKFCLSAYYNKT